MRITHDLDTSILSGVKERIDMRKEAVIIHNS